MAKETENPLEVGQTREVAATAAENINGDNNGNNDEEEFTPAKIVAKAMADENREINLYERVIKVVNTIKKIDGDNGEYHRVALSFEKPVDGYVAHEDPDEGIVWERGKTNMVFVIFGSILATIKNNKELAPYYDSIREDPRVLYTILAGTKVKSMLEYVPADTPYVNPFSTTGKEREYDHDWCATAIYEITELGKAAKDWLKIKKLERAGVFKSMDLDMLLGL